MKSLINVTLLNKLLFSLLLLSLFNISIYHGQNIIENFDFENGLSGWDSYFGTGYSGTLTQSSVEHSGNYAARINITQVPSNPQTLNVQIKTNEFHIQAGNDYHLSMWLRADRNVDVQIILIKNSSPWTWLASKTVSLNTSYQHFDLLDTNAPFTTDDDVRLAIRCGNEVAKIYLDDVVFTNCTSPSSYSSFQTSITGKGKIKINDQNIETTCIDACNDQFLTNTNLVLTQEAEPGYTFSGWSGACSGTANCQVSLSQAKYVGAHFSLTGADNSLLDYRNQTDWGNTGYDGAIPYDGNIIDMTQSPYNCVGNGTHNNYNALLTVLSDVTNMPGFNIIYFPAGNYLIEGHESFTLPSNTVIRGECPSNTTLTVKPTEVGPNNLRNHIFKLYRWNSGTVGYEPVKGGYHKRSNSITLDNISGFSIGDLIEIRQDNDTNKMSSNLVPSSLDQATFSNAYNNWGANAVGELFKVIGLHHNTLILDRGFHYTYDPKLNPRIKKLSYIENVGIENIKIHRPVQKDNHNIEIQGCYNCWIRNIESSYTQKSHINLARSYHVEIRDNYFHHSYDYGGGGHGYGIAINHRSSNCLIENNIFYTLRHAMVLSYSPNGNTFGYNYSEESWDPTGNAGFGDQKADISLHGFFPLMNLFEGNVVEYIHSSDWWGPSGPGNTFYRNRANKEEFKISDNSDYQNVIANELIYDPFGFWQDNFDIHSSVDFTTKHSNNDLGNIDDNSKINYLTNSLYRPNTIPNFCDGFPYPQIGPVYWLSNNSGQYPYSRSKIPAQHKFDNATNKVECLLPCNFSSGLLDQYETCDSIISLQLNSETEFTRLYGFGIYDIPTSNIGAGDTPDLYVKLYKNGTLLQSTSNSVIETYPDTYIKISSIILDATATYELKVYDDDPWPNPDDYIGSVTFSGNNPSNYQTNYISGELLGIYLNKHTYKTKYNWSDGVTSNPRSFTESGTYYLEIIQKNGCINYDTTTINLGGTPVTSGLHTWVGVDNDWFSKCNWDKFHVPDILDEVLIPNNLTNYPVISGTGYVSGYDMNGDGVINSQDETIGKAYCKSIEIQNGGNLEIKVTSGAELIIYD